MRHIGILFFAVLVTVASSTRLVGEIVDFFTKILQHHDKHIFDVEAYKILMYYFDGDARCSAQCEAHLQNWLGEGWPFSRLHEVVDKIYEGQISDDPYQPQEVHLALTSEVTSMKVMWTTMKNLNNPFAQYKLAQESDWKVAKLAYASNSTYEVEQKWWPVFTGVIYETDMTDLKPGLSYNYRVGGWDSANNTVRYSKDFTFRATPESNNPNRKTVVTTLADHGTVMFFGFLTIDQILAKMTDIDMDFVFVAGDLSYAGLSSAIPPLNITKEDEFEHIWDLLLIQNEPISSQYPWMVGDGNHERFYNWTAFTNRYKMPQNDFGSVGNFWYDFDYANIHWVSISSEHSLDEGSPQQLFLESSLQRATANRANVPWIILTLHKPLYCSADGTPGGFADKLESILIKYDVDLTITGHMHLYERIHPVENGIVTVYPEKKLLHDVYHSTGKGPVHVVQGNTGAMQWETWVQPQPQWSAIRFANGFIPLNRTTESVTVGVDGPILPSNYTNTYGFGVITVWNSTHLQYDAMADTESRVGTDQFWIVKRLE